MEFEMEKPHKFERFDLIKFKKEEYDYIPKDKWADCFVYEDGRPIECNEVAFFKDTNGEPIFYVIVETRNKQIIIPFQNGKVKYARVPIRQVFLRPGYHIWVGGQEFIGYNLPVPQRASRCFVYFKEEDYENDRHL